MRRLAMGLGAVALAIGLALVAAQAEETADNASGASGAVAAPAETKESAAAATEEPAGLDAQLEKDIRTLIDLTGAANITKQVSEQLVTQFKQRLPNVPEEFWQKQAGKIDSDEVTKAIVTVYAKHFTDEEVKQMIAFYDSAVGKKMREMQPVVAKEIRQAGMSFGQRFSNELLQALKEGGYLPQQ